MKVGYEVVQFVVPAFAVDGDQVGEVHVVEVGHCAGQDGEQGEDEVEGQLGLVDLCGVCY